MRILYSGNAPLILVTNDDGVHAPGIKALVEAVRSFGDVVVVAPGKGMSGMAHAVTVSTPVSLTRLNCDSGLAVYKSNGTPADCVKLAMNVLLERKPDFIVSGINHGTNSSVSIHYSGTLGAAREGALHGIPSIGFSLLNYEEDADFGPATLFAREIFAMIMNLGAPNGIYYNVNIPDGKNIKGIKICRQAKGHWVEEFEEREDPRGRKYYWLTGRFKNNEPDAIDTDEWALSNGFASIVPCTVDATNYQALELLNAGGGYQEINKAITR